MTKQKEVVEILEKMTPIGGYALNAPMSNERYVVLMNKFESLDKECTEIADQYLQQA